MPMRRRFVTNGYPGAFFNRFAELGFGRPLHFVMERRMLTGIKERVEGTASPPAVMWLATLGFLAAGLFASRAATGGLYPRHGDSRRPPRVTRARDVARNFPGRLGNFAHADTLRLNRIREILMAEKLLLNSFMSSCMTSPGSPLMVAVTVAGMRSPRASQTCEREAFDTIVRIVRAEFVEMPEMRLTRIQFRRLWHLGEAECERVIAHLLGCGFLREGGQGWIGRPHDR